MRQLRGGCSIGLDLPDDVLRHVYYRNALRIIPGLDASLSPE